MALSARREIHESWISRKRESVASWRSPYRAFPSRHQRLRSEWDERERDEAKAEGKRRGQVGREGVDLQSGRYLQVKDSHCRLEHNVRHVVRIIRRIEGIRFVPPLLPRLPCHGCLLRSNFVSAQESGSRYSKVLRGMLPAIARFSSGNCRADGSPLTRRNYGIINTFTFTKRGLYHASLKGETPVWWAGLYPATITGNRVIERRQSKLTQETQSVKRHDSPTFACRRFPRRISWFSPWIFISVSRCCVHAIACT